VANPIHSAAMVVFVVLCVNLATSASNDTETNNYSNASNFLANERTYLAWIRTALAMMSIGFGAAKLSGSSVSAIVLSIFALSSGGFLGGFATWRYFDVINQLEGATFSPDKYGPALMSMFLAISAVAFTTWIVWDNSGMCSNVTSRKRTTVTGTMGEQLRKSFRDDDDSMEPVEYRPSNSPANHSLLHNLVKPQPVLQDYDDTNPLHNRANN